MHIEFLARIEQAIRGMDDAAVGAYRACTSTSGCMCTESPLRPWRERPPPSDAW